MLTKTREQILKMADEKYCKFSASLIPGVDHMLGIRLPELRVRVALIIMMQHLLKCDSCGRKMSRVRNVSMTDLVSFQENGLVEKEREIPGQYLEWIFAG